jgi:hypothetical protein
MRASIDQRANPPAFAAKQHNALARQVDTHGIAPDLSRLDHGRPDIRKALKHVPP